MTKIQYIAIRFMFPIAGNSKELIVEGNDSDKKYNLLTLKDNKIEKGNTIIINDRHIIYTEIITKAEALTKLLRSEVTKRTPQEMSKARRDAQVERLEQKAKEESPLPPEVE